MRIQHNIPAMSAYRNYTHNVSAVNKNLEKLSSGYRINRAGDDAAGLAISEKMRAQISGLEQAQSNAKSGINLVQTAEGALTEVHDMLNRMYTLAEQSANGTYDDDVDRKQLQKEVESLRKEIDRIADSTNYNGINLLDGSKDTSAAEAAAADAKTFSGVSITAITDHSDSSEAQKLKFSYDLTSLKLQSTSTGNETMTVMVAGVTLTTSVSAGVGIVNGEALSIGSTTQAVVGGVTCSVSFSDGILTFEALADPTTTAVSGINDVTVTASANGSYNTGEGIQAHILQRPALNDIGRQAQGSFALTDEMVKDGARLTIGNTTYTFAVGKDTKVDLTEENVIDLSDIEADSTTGKVSADDLKVAAAKLSGVAKDKGDFIVTNDADSATIKLTERVDAKDGANYEDYDLTGASTTSLDATWKNVVKYSTTAAPETSSSGTGKALTLQIGDTADDFNKLTVSIKDMHARAMKFTEADLGENATDLQKKVAAMGLSIGNIDISSQEGASNAMAVIKNATNYVSDVRGDLGALQNRLDHTINNLSVTQENIQDAESTIRDVDIAKEMMAYTKNNILVQSAQAMLAQANQLPQGVLQLLG